MSTTWNSAFELTPANSDSASRGADRIRTSKSAIRERFEKEHHMDLGSGTLTDDGYHLHGSAVAWYQATEPTTSPDGTALGAKDKGRIWIDSDDKNPYIYTGSAFVAMIADDADKVSAFGIGAIKDLGAVNLNAVFGNGLYKVVGGTNGPVGTCYGTLIVNTYAASTGSEYSHQIFIQTGSSTSTKTIYTRRCEGGTWDTWAQMWGSNNDGNGGQPPAPKPKAYSSGGIAEWYSIDAAENAALTLPAGGKYAYIVYCKNASPSSFGSIKHWSASVAAGGTTIALAQGAGTYNQAMIYREE